MKKLGLYLGCCLALAGCAAPRPTAGPGVLPGAGATAGPNRGTGDTITAGETLEIYVMEDDNLSGRYAVRPGGHVIMPGVGRVTVAGLTTSEAEAAIRRGLQANQLKTATVMVERSAGAAPAAAESVTVFFGGAVLTPGRRVVSFVSGRRPTLFQGILEAGGLTRFADQRKVTITRRGSTGRSEVTTINVEQVRQGAAVDPALEDGDIVNVPEKTFGW